MANTGESGLGVGGHDVKRRDGEAFRVLFDEVLGVQLGLVRHEVGQCGGLLCRLLKVKCHYRLPSPGLTGLVMLSS